MMSRMVCARPKDCGSIIERMSVSSLMLPLKVLLSSSFSAVTSRYCASASSTTLPRTSSEHGLVRNRKMLPSLTTLMAPSRSALPVSMMRTVSGARSLTSDKNRMPSMRGICRSDTTTANGPRAAIFSSAASPPSAVSIWNLRRKFRSHDASKFGSSSTNRIFSVINRVLIQVSVVSWQLARHDSIRSPKPSAGQTAVSSCGGGTSVLVRENSCAKTSAVWTAIAGENPGAAHCAG